MKALSLSTTAQACLLLDLHGMALGRTVLTAGLDHKPAGALVKLARGFPI